MADRDWKDELIESARASAIPACRDETDAVLMAEARLLLPPGGALDRLADAFADDLAGNATRPVDRATCAALVRAAANLRGLILLGFGTEDILGVLSAAGAKLEMRASADG
jgi:hypothetical protein